MPDPSTTVWEWRAKSDSANAASIIQVMGAKKSGELRQRVPALLRGIVRTVATEPICRRR